MSRTSRTALRLVAVPAVVATVMAVAPNLTGVANAVPPTGSFLNPASSAISGPGNVLSDKPDGTDSTYRIAVRANDPDVGGSIASVQIQIKGCNETTFQSIGNATRVGSTDTWVLNWDESTFTPQADITGCATGAIRALVTDSNAETSFVGGTNGQLADFEDSSAPTVHINTPANGSNFGFFTTGGGTTTTSSFIGGTASADTTSVNVFYTKSAAGTDPVWTQCGSDSSPSANTDGTKSFGAACALSGSDTAADVTAVAARAVANVTPGSGDAVRVTGYAQSLNSFSITPSSDTQSVGFCNTYSVQLRDQNGAAIVGAPIQVNVQGTATGTGSDAEDAIRFAQNFAAEGTASDPFGTSPAAGATTEPTNQCDSVGEPDSSPDDVDGNANGPNESVLANAADTPAVKAITGATEANGNFRFSLSLQASQSAAAGTYGIKAFLDNNGDGVQNAASGSTPAEPGSTATKTFQAQGVNTLTASPPNATNVIGEPHKITATVKDQNGNPIQGQVVTFRVTSGPNSNNDIDNNNTTPTGVIGQCTTGVDGTCSVTYTSTATGTDTIAVFLDANNNFAPDDAKSVTVTKTWVSTSNATCIDVEPNDGHNPTTQGHTITAFVTDGHMGPNGDVKGQNDCTGNPLSNVPVDFTVEPDAGPDSTLSPDNNGDAQHERVFTNGNGVATVTLNDESATATGTNFVNASIPGSGFSFVTPNFQDISATGTSVGLNCDDCANQVLLPFGFQYAGQTFTSVNVSSNGFLDFQNAADDYPGQPFPSTDDPNGGVVGGYWTDLDARNASGGSVTYQVTGTAPNRVVVVEFKNVPYCCGNGNGSTTFEFKLFEGSNNIEVHYGAIDNVDNGDEAASAGVENLDGTGGTQYFFTDDASTLDPSGTAVRYAPSAENGRRSETVSKDWDIAGKATNIDCTPTTARNVQGQQHTINCTLTDAFGTGVAGHHVAFRVTSGPNSGNDLDSNPATTPGFIAEGTTDAGGHVSATYTGISPPSTTPDTITIWDDVNQNGATTSGPDAGDGPDTSVEKYWTIAANLSNAQIAIDMNPGDNTDCEGTCDNSTPVGTVNDTKCDADLGSGFGETESTTPQGDWQSRAFDTVGQVEAVCVSVKGADGNIQYGLNVTLTSSGVGVLTNDDGTATGQTSQTHAIQDDGYAIFYITSNASGDQHLTATAQGGNESVSGTKTWQPFPVRNIKLENVGGNTAPPGGTHQVRVTLTDRNGNPVADCVEMKEQGPGHFRDNGFGGTDPSFLEVCTDETGVVLVELETSPNESGTETVTATVEQNQTTGECAQPANKPAAGNPAGNCTASVQIIWGQASPPPPVAKSLPAYRQGSANNFRGSLTSGPPNSSFGFGNRGDVPLWGDWNGDGTPSIGVYRPSNRTFYLANNNNTAVAIQVTIGNSGDLPAAGDFNGDGTDSIALFRPSTGTWYITNNDHTVVSHFVYGQNGDRPIVGDWTGTGHSQVGVYRPSTGVFYRIGHAGIKFGNKGDTPIVGDWDGNGTTTIGVVRGTTWYVSNNNSTAATSFTFGATGARPFTWSTGASPAAPTSS